MSEKQVQEKEKEDLVMYWHISFWDRPLEGVAMYMDSPVYFKLIEEDDDDDDDDDEHEQDQMVVAKYDDEPTYALHALTEAQYHELEAQHEEFGRLVGRHTDHRPGIYAPYTTTSDNNGEGTRSRVQQWYESAANWKLSFSPTRQCPRIATVPWTAFANYQQPTTSATNS